MPNNTSRIHFGSTHGVDVPIHRAEVAEKLSAGLRNFELVEFQVSGKNVDVNPFSVTLVTGD